MARIAGEYSFTNLNGNTWGKSLGILDTRLTLTQAHKPENLRSFVCFLRVFTMKKKKLKAHLTKLEQDNWEMGAFLSKRIVETQERLAKVEEDLSNAARFLTRLEGKFDELMRRDE